MSAGQEIQETRDALASLIYTAERCADLIVSVSDRYDLDVAVESAKAFLAGRAAGAGVGRYAPTTEATENIQIKAKAGFQTLSLSCGHSIKKPDNKWRRYQFSINTIHCPHCKGFKK